MSIELLGLSFHLYGFILGAALVVSLSIVEYVLKKEQIVFDFSKVSFLVIVSGIIGARLYHVITDWQLYKDGSVVEIFSIWNGGLGVIGAFLGGGLALLVTLRYFHQQKYLISIFDALALAIPFGQALGRWGNYVNQELYGLPTNLPWGISIDQQFLPDKYQTMQHVRFHPLFLYESIVMTFVGFLFWFLYVKKRDAIQFGTGRLFGMYVVSYGLIRFVLEFLRIESARSEGVLSVFTTAQWMSLLFVFIGVIMIVRSISQQQGKKV